MRVVGVTIEAGTLFLAATDPATSLDRLADTVDNGSRRVTPSSGLGDARKHVDLTERIAQDLRALAATHVVLARTRRYANLTYKEAFARVSAMCALMAACEACGVEYLELTTEAIAKRTGGEAKALQDTPYEHFGFQSLPPYWRSGMAKAFAAASAHPSTENAS